MKSRPSHPHRPIPHADLAFLRVLAEKATASEGDATEKWDANSQLWAWFRHDPVAVIEALQAHAAVAERPGGIANQLLQTTIRALPPVQL
jgi:hypothetical protein